jgi:hypothetical protein
MQIIGRTLIILVAALVVVGATFAVTQSGAAASVVGSQERGEGEAPAPDAVAAQDLPAVQTRPEGELNSGGPDEAATWVHGLGQVVRTVGVMAVIVAVVARVQSVARRRRPAPRARPHPPAPTRPT